MLCLKTYKMAEIILERRKAAAVVSVTNPLIILLIICIFQQNTAQVINRVPHFIPQTGDMSQFSLPEGTAVGTPVYHLKGIDPDNGKLTYSISGQFFSVDSLTGVVTLAKALDREEQANLEVIISITDEGTDDTEPNTVSLRRVIPVRDVNDNPPVFHNRPYIVNISEASAVGSEIEVTPNIIVTDRDEGDNAKIQVHCSARERGSDVEACSTFRVVTDMITPNKYQVRLFLSKPLDYESRSAYVLTLDASDVSQNSLHAIGSVSVAIQDIQDQPPVFINAPYSATVPENTSHNTKIMEIIAKDGDTANPRPVLLTLEGDTQRYFRLQPERSIGRATLVTTDVPVDRESDIVVQNGGVYNFFVKATELINNEIPSDFTVIPITIIVTDVDDHIPVFNRDVFDISIPENIENGSPIPELSIYIEDYDLGQNSKYDLHIRNVRNSDNVFAISTDHGEGRTPISIKVKDSSKLDYDVDDEEKRLFSFDIVASLNNVELSAARVNIKLLDMNDNAPVFLKPQYKFNVLENAIVGFKIGDVQATDKDYGIFGEIEYSLSGFGSFLFKTDKIMGGLFIANTLDYETQKSYSLNLLAKDGGGKSTSVSIFIEVLDTNDNAPIFEASEYSRTIRDGATSFEPQLVIRATDADGPTQGGGRIRYSLESDNSIAHKGEVFAIDEETGEISINDKVETMDTPRGQYDILVRATDYGKPPLHNETRVFIRVGVPGNQRPTFKGNYHHYKYTVNQLELNEDYTFDLNAMNYKASIREDATPGQNITTVIAHDPDGMDELLTYHIISGSKDNFVINEKTGLITVSNDANLDRDINPDRYEIIVSAVDSGIPIPETATTTVFVTIQDVNDKPPKFNKTDSTTYISERANVNDVVTKIVAHDSDLSGKLKYSFIEPLKAFSKAGVQIKANYIYDYKNMFKINEDSGEILVNSTLDYNQVSKVILTVKVTDINAEVNKDQQFALLEHTIYIQPYADKNPQFTNPGWTNSNPTIHHKIKEEQPIGSTVLVLMAEDPTSGHIVSNFKVISSQTSLIQVNPLSGQVVLTNNLDYEDLINPNLTLTVQATSNDGSKHSIANVIVEVINLNDNPPVFNKELYKVSILESIKELEQIVTVHANDSDAVLTEEDKANGFSDVRYSIKGENSELLTIDNVTGIIQVAPNKTLDRERQSVLRLEVEASDTPSGGSNRLRSVTTVLIDVLDVDDNTPEFDKNVYTAVVPENVPIGIGVVKLTAIDPDEGLGGEIKYEFLDEGEAHGLFTIDVATGEVTTRSALTGRGRTDPYRLLVGAVDGGGHTGDASLSLYIGDVSANDGVPRFIRPAVGETLSVSENATIGTPLFQVVASDPDDPTQPSGQLFYSIQQSNADAKVFSLEPDTGLLSTRQTLDRERQSSYTLVLVVTDRGAPPQQSSRIVTVRVEDVDDHKPRFARALDDPPLLITTQEEVPIETIVGTLEAIDEDIDENAAIDYVITAGNELELVKLKRTNDSKANIISAARLDREAVSRLLLTIKCFKLDTKPRITKDYNRLDLSEIQVVIKILDVDDHLPVFESSNMTVGVRLNVAVDTVIATVKAADKDPEALPIKYNIFNMTFVSPIKSKSSNNITNVIVLNNVTGELKIMKNLIHFADGIFRLVVRANNSNEADRHSDLEVEVVVVRERDLLRLVLGGDGRGARGRVAGLRERVSAVLTPQRLKLQLHDAPRHDIYDNLGPCFQFRKMDTGEALSPNAMKATIRSLGAQFQDILQTYSVHNITQCGARRARPAPAQAALLSLAALLPAAAFVATIVLCCMHSGAKRRMRASVAREPPPRLYTEPLYST